MGLDLRWLPVGKPILHLQKRFATAYTYCSILMRKARSVTLDYVHMFKAAQKSRYQEQ